MMAMARPAPTRSRNAPDAGDAGARP